MIFDVKGLLITIYNLQPSSPYRYLTSLTSSSSREQIKNDPEDPKFLEGTSLL